MCGEMKIRIDVRNLDAFRSFSLNLEAWVYYTPEFAFILNFCLKLLS